MSRLYICHVEQGQRGTRIRGAVLRYGVVGVKTGDHVRAELLCAEPRIFGEFRETESVVPAETALRFFRSEEIVRIGFQPVSQVKILHQAGVKADQVKLHAAVLYGLDDLAGGHQALAVSPFVELLRAVAVGKPSAVIPEYEHVAVCGIVLFGPFDEVGEGLFFRHAGGRIQIQSLLYFAVINRVTGIGTVLHAAREQALCRAHLKDKGHI